MSMGILLRQIAIIFLEIGVGYAGAKMQIITDRDSKFLSDLVMKIFLACTLLASTDIDAGGSMVVKMLEGFVILEVFYVFCAIVCQLLSRKMGLTHGQKAVLIGTAVLPNSAFIGIPLATGILGTTLGSVYAASGLIAYNLFFFTYVVRLFQPDKKLDLKSFATPANFFTIVMIVMLITGWHLPGVLQDFIGAMGNCTTPLALIIIGVMLAGSDLKTLVKRPFLYLCTGLRCIAFPLILTLILWLLPLDRTLCMGIVILASCPAGSLAAVLARQYDMESELAGQVVAHSTLSMIVTAPLILGLAGSLYAF